MPVLSYIDCMYIYTVGLSPMNFRFVMHLFESLNSDSAVNLMWEELKQ